MHTAIVLQIDDRRYWVGSWDEAMYYIGNRFEHCLVHADGDVVVIDLY